MQNNSKETGKLLISKGAYLNTNDIIYQIIKILLLKTIILYSERKSYNNNSTLLHFASIGDSKEMGELLISKGADINTKDFI